MSTFVHDLPSSVWVAASLPPVVLSASGVGIALDFGAGDGPCFAIQQVGQLSDGAVLAGKVQESADALTWTDVAGAVFPPADVPGAAEVIPFPRTKRYLRWSGTLTGDSPTVPAAVVIGQQRKTF